MPRIVTFVDTSILTEILAVPGKSQNSTATRAEFRQRTIAGETLVLPTAAIIETGNHIGQLGDGGHRRKCAEGLVRFLQAMSGGQSPWTMHGANWDAELLERLCRGARGCPSLPDMASRGVGVGDISILAEAEAYEARVGTSVTVRIWTTDNDLLAYA